MMTEKETLTKQQRAELCTEERCKEHNGGDVYCPIPLYKKELKRKETSSKSTSNSLKERVETKTATGHVVRNNE
jgi:hypothetical protein